MLDQLPHEGTQVKGGRTVYVTINSFSQKKVEVPYVAGRSLRQAKNMLEIAGLEIDRLVYQPDMATNYVLEQRVDGRPIEAGTKRQIEMGSGGDALCGRGRGRFGRRRAEGDRRVAARGQKAACGSRGST